jgi:hypothetical protein
MGELAIRSSLAKLTNYHTMVYEVTLGTGTWVAPEVQVGS